MNTPKCHTCGQNFPTDAGRICALCGKKIGAREKYRFIGGTTQDRDCSNPTMEVATEAPQPRLIEDRP